MKKLVAFILVLALCLSLCSVALATPAPDAPSSCNINIIHAIGAYWIARTIVERAKEVEVETVNLSDFLKWALPVGIAAVGTAATVGIIYALLKGNCGEDADEPETVYGTIAEVLATVDNFPSSENKNNPPDNAWSGINEIGTIKCYICDGKLTFWSPNGDAGDTYGIPTATPVTKIEDNYSITQNIVTFTMTGGKLGSIQLQSTNPSFTKHDGTYTAPGK